MALDLQGLVDRRRGPCRHELFPGRGDRLRACEDLEGILAEVAVRPGSGTHGGDLAEVGHQGGEVTCAKRSVVHGLATGVRREGQVGGNPGDGGDEAGHTGSAAHGRVVGALQAVVVNGLVKEDDSLAQVCSSLHCVNYTFRADPRQLFWLRIIEEILKIAKGLVLLQALGLADHLVNAGQLLPCLRLLYRSSHRGTRGKHCATGVSHLGGHPSHAEQRQASADEVPLAGGAGLRLGLLVA
mmetsp:Transcript_22738/g.46776  ORF Transcript_22738/g.46776 Transcript_22738/m.46776 type:complete len:241 (+) Transcript_22738:436-1158(+)